MFTRRHLRTDVIREVERRLVLGLLPEGKINESALSIELGISRTPLREALLGLEQQQLVRSTPGRGFIVTPLTRSEAEELYPLLALLQPMALRLGAPAIYDSVDRLRPALHQAALGESDLERLLECSAIFSRVIADSCPSRTLACMLDDLTRRSLRYERLNLEHAGISYDLQAGLALHHAVVDALEAREIDSAAAHLATTWQQCLEALRTHLPDRPEP